MRFEYSPYVIPLAFATLVSVVIIFYAWTRRETRGAKGLVALGLGAAIWALGYALEIAGADLQTKLIWGKIQYFGIVIIPLAWMVLAFVYAELEARLPRPVIMALGVIPLITLFLVFTNEIHGLIWEDYYIYHEGSFSALQITHGLWFWVYWAFSQVAILIGMVVLFRAFLSARGTFRRRVVLVLIAVLAPWIANIISIANLMPVPMDLTPFAFTISVVAMTWAIFRMRLLDIVPIARDLVLESIQDGVIVLDLRRNVVDINITAARMIGFSATQAIGKDAVDIFFPWPHLDEKIRDTMDAKDEIVIGSGNAQIRYQVRFSPLYNRAGQSVGRIITLHSMGDEVSIDSRSNTQPPKAQSATQNEEVIERTAMSANPLWATLRDFFLPSLSEKVFVPVGSHPVWFRTRERIFTIGIRLVALLGILAYLMAALDRLIEDAAVFIIVAILLVLIWWLGIARKINYSLRTSIFLAILFSLALLNVLSFGLVPESYIFFMSFVIAAAILRSPAETFVTFLFVTGLMFVSAYLIGSDNFVPFMRMSGENIIPHSIQEGLGSVTLFTVGMFAGLTTIVMLLDSLNRAWTREAQSRNLIQQERDLLEQRVVERTRALVDARDIIKESEVRFRQLVEYASDIIYRTDSQGNFVYVNPVSVKAMGYGDESEVLGKNYLDLAAPDWRQTLQRFYGRQFVKREKNTYFEFPAISAKGEIIWLGQSVQLIEENSQIVGFQAVARDITQLKQVYEALTIARDQALDASNFKSQILSKVSHELRTPLGGVLGYAELLQYETYGSLTDQQKNAVFNIIDSAHYLNQLISDLLDEAQIEAKTLRLSREPVILTDFLSRVETILSLLTRKKGLVYSVVMDPNLPERLFGDEKRLQQVLVNLIGNAVKFTSSGEVLVRFFRFAEEQWAMQVCDTGVGISKDAQAYIFEPFRQVDNAITQENLGSGLGLSITKQLVELMGGQVLIESELGRGSIFTITLPLITVIGEAQ